jgi:hypothetical protein
MEDVIEQLKPKEQAVVRLYIARHLPRDPSDSPHGRERHQESDPEGEGDAGRMTALMSFTRELSSL